MRVPIQYALTAPEHAPRTATALDLPRLGSLTFESPDLNRFPALEICRRAGEAGGSSSAALCAADEVAVEAFLSVTFRLQQFQLHSIEQSSGTRLRP